MDLSNVQKLLLVVFSLAVIVAGIGLAGKANKGSYSDTARTSFNVLAAVVIVAIGAGGLVVATFGSKVLTLLGLK